MRRLLEMSKHGLRGCDRIIYNGKHSCGNKRSLSEDSEMHLLSVRETTSLQQRQQQQYLMINSSSSSMTLAAAVMQSEQAAVNLCN